VRRSRIFRRRNEGCARIGRREKDTFLDFPITLLDLGALIGIQFLQLVKIGVDRIGEIARSAGSLGTMALPRATGRSR